MQAELDRTDLRMLRELQKNGRIAIVELAEKVSLSPTACRNDLPGLCTVLNLTGQAV